MSYVVAAVLIAHFETGELPPRAGRPAPVLELGGGRARDLVNEGVSDAAKATAAATADRYFPKAKRKR